MNYADEIRDLMAAAGVDDVCFIYHRNKPTFKRNGYTYEVVTIFAPEDGAAAIQVDAIPRYCFRMDRVVFDDGTRGSSWRHLLDIVKNEIKRLEGEL